MRGFGRVFMRKNSRYWQISYYVNGKEHRESSKSERRADAKALLRRRLDEVYRLGDAPNRILVSDALKDYLANAELRGLRSLDVFKRSCALIEKKIGTMRAKEVNTAILIRLQKDFTEDGYAAATVNRMVTMTYSALKLAARSGQLVVAPQPPPQLRKPKPRQGFLEYDDFVAIRDELPDWAADAFEFAYFTGWRRNEVLWLRWDELDLRAGFVRLDPDRSKNRESRVWPIQYLISDVIRRRVLLRDLVVPYVFHREGHRISLSNWGHHWRRATKRAGRPGKLLHDCRRTAVRNLERAGVPRNIAMKLTGHRTETVYTRYDIVNEADLEAAGQKLAEYLDLQASRVDRKILPFGG